MCGNKDCPKKKMGVKMRLMVEVMTEAINTFKFWLPIAPDECDSTIADLTYRIAKRCGIANEPVVMQMKRHVVTGDTTVGDILRDEDKVVIKRGQTSNRVSNGNSGSFDQQRQIEANNSMLLDSVDVQKYDGVVSERSYQHSDDDHQHPESDCSDCTVCTSPGNDIAIEALNPPEESSRKKPRIESTAGKAKIIYSTVFVDSVAEQPEAAGVEQQVTDIKQLTKSKKRRMRRLAKSQSIGSNNSNSEKEAIDYGALPLLVGYPRMGARIVFKTIELSPLFTPEISDYKIATVLRYNGPNILLKLEPNSQTTTRPKPADCWGHSKVGLLQSPVEESQMEVEYLMSDLIVIKLL